MHKVEQELEQILDAVHLAVQRADFATLSALTPLCADALANLSPQTASTGLTRLSDKARRNATLLDAAGRGLKSAARRLGELNAAQTSLVTYDIRGQRAESGPAPSISRRF